MEDNKVNFDDFKIENIFNPQEINEEVNTEEEESNAETASSTEEKTEEKETSKKEETNSKTVETKTNGVSEEDDEEDDSDEADFKPFVQALHEKFGWDFTDETLEDNSFDGVINHLSSIVESNVEAIIDEELSVGDGSLKKMYEYMKDGGDPKKFVDVYFRPVDYSSVDLEDNDDMQIKVVSDLLSRQGYDNDEIKDKIETYKEANILEKEANIAKKKMVAIEAKEKESIILEQKEYLKQKEEAQKNYWNSVKTSIKNWEKVGDFPIVEKDKDNFFRYLTERDKEGRTQYEKELAQDKEAAIKMAYIQYKKFNTESIKKTVKSEVTKDIKKTLNKFTDSNAKSKTADTKSENANKYTGFKLPWA